LSVCGLDGIIFLLTKEWEEGRVERLYTAKYCVSRAVRKYGVRPEWVWEAMDRCFGVAKGDGGKLWKSERDSLDRYIEMCLHDKGASLPPR
jgi:hypothetical protein